MLRIVIMRGGLGNQMFTYAFYTMLRQKFRLSIILYESAHCFNAHNGFELPDVFPKVENKRTYKFYHRLQKCYTQYVTRFLFRRVIECNAVDYYYNLKEIKFPFLVYEGYWQSESYFSQIRNKIIQLFQFDEKKLSEKSKAISLDISNENSISIHVRRGDYLQNEELGNICSLQYYQTAINIIKQKIRNPRFYLFTDDRKWVIDNFKFVEYILIDWNLKQESWQDMYLMTKCRHNIIANSSFSWWGAWLNQNPNKIIISPQKWFNKKVAPNITPITWLKI